MRVNEWSRSESLKVEESDRIHLLAAIVKNGGKVTLYNDIEGWHLPIVRRMINDGDERIQLDPHSYGVMIVTINEDKIDSITEAKISKFLLSSIDEEGE